jgi:type III pantothenate kinase
MILAIDAGNTRTKWGVFDDKGILTAQGALDNIEIPLLPEMLRNFSGLRRAVASNVAGEAVATRLTIALAALSIPILWVQSQAVACGVKNGYQQPEQLGTDRWAALVAAWNAHHMACVVVNAGTALTVDALSGDGEFLGGVIVPGFGLMRESLATGTASVAVTSGLWRDFPTSTADAVQTGTLTAMAGAVQHMATLLELREGRPPQCLLSGGDAELLAAALPRPSLIVPNLVLLGLFLLEKTSV